MGHRLYTICSLWLAGYLLVVSFSVSASTWQQETQKYGITVFSRAVTGSSIREVRAELELDTNLKKLIAFLQDPSRNSDWVPYSGGATVLDQPTPNRTIVHFRLQSQWPFKPRDAVAAFTLVQDPQTKTVTIEIESLPDFIKVEKGTVRLRTYEGFWRLTPVTRQKIKVLYQNRVDPEGLIPAWMSNRFAIQTTLDALHNLKQLLPGYEADVSKLDFIKE